MVEGLEKSREPLPNMEAIYIISPTESVSVMCTRCIHMCVHVMCVGVSYNIYFAYVDMLLCHLTFLQHKLQGDVTNITPGLKPLDSYFYIDLVCEAVDRRFGFCYLSNVYGSAHLFQSWYVIRLTMVSIKQKLCVNRHVRVGDDFSISILFQLVHSLWWPG